jgi:hypothetical protein
MQSLTEKGRKNGFFKLHFYTHVTLKIFIAQQRPVLLEKTFSSTPAKKDNSPLIGVTTMESVIKKGTIAGTTYCP